MHTLEWPELAGCGCSGHRNRRHIADGQAADVNVAYGASISDSRRIFCWHKGSFLLCVVCDSKRYIARIQLLPAVEYQVIHTHGPSPGPPPATRFKEANRESAESIRLNAYVTSSTCKIMS